MRTIIRGPLAGTTGGAIAEQALKACVHCGMCNATCPTYQIRADELEGPRGRIYLMKQALEGEPVSRLTLDHLDSCLSCRACETTCPSGVAYHQLYDIAHPVIAEAVKWPAGERLFRFGIRQLTRSPILFRMALTLGGLVKPLLPPQLKARITPPPPPSPWPRTRQARRMSLLPGCVQSATAPHFNATAARVLDRAGISLVESRKAGCCGAVSFHLEAPEEARRAARRNIQAWEADGTEAIVATSSGCASFIRDYPDLLRDDPAFAERARAVAARVRDPLQVLAETPPVALRAPGAPRIAVQEPCSLQHGLKLTGQIASLLRQLGYEPQPIADNHLCCGSAGAYSLTQPEMSARLRDNKLAALSATSPAAIYTANIGCWMHLAEATDIPVRHWIEAVDEVTRP